ncbi:MAG TPA: thiamine phosphate synthase [Polyangiaceae bacterium]|nr:thiamine phosphate synthase [Polyangiaceae bacterium]
MNEIAVPAADVVEGGAAPPFRPVLIVITDENVAPGAALDARLERVLAAARPRTVLVQLRHLSLPVRVRLAIGARLRALCTRHEQWLSVNDRADLAFAVRADGVHLGERSVTPADARRLLPRAFVSHACHDLDALDAEGSHAAVLSPILAPRKGRAPLGVGGVRRARALLEARRSTTLLYALGGVDASSAAPCIEAGATGVAVIGAALDGRDPVPLLCALGIEK